MCRVREDGNTTRFCIKKFQFQLVDYVENETTVQYPIGQERINHAIRESFFLSDK